MASDSSKPTQQALVEIQADSRALARVDADEDVRAGSRFHGKGMLWSGAAVLGILAAGAVLGGSGLTVAGGALAGAGALAARRAWRHRRLRDALDAQWAAPETLHPELAAMARRQASRDAVAWEARGGVAVWLLTRGRWSEAVGQVAVLPPAPWRGRGLTAEWARAVLHRLIPGAFDLVASADELRGIYASHHHAAVSPRAGWDFFETALDVVRAPAFAPSSEVTALCAAEAGSAVLFRKWWRAGASAFGVYLLGLGARILLPSGPWAVVPLESLALGVGATLAVGWDRVRVFRRFDPALPRAWFWELSWAPQGWALKAKFVEFRSELPLVGSAVAAERALREGDALAAWGYLEWCLERGQALATASSKSLRAIAATLVRVSASVGRYDVAERVLAECVETRSSWPDKLVRRSCFGDAPAALAWAEASMHAQRGDRPQCLQAVVRAKAAPSIAMPHHVRVAYAAVEAWAGDAVGCVGDDVDGRGTPR